MKHFVLTGLLMFSSLASPQSYKIIDLGQLIPAGINVEGEVAGNLHGYAEIWTLQGGAKALGVLPEGKFSHAAAINDLGVVAGTADGAGIVFDANSGFVSCGNLTQPFLWTHSQGFVTAQSIPLVFSSGPPCDEADYATGVNIRNQVVGSNLDFATYKYGFLWDKSSVSLFKGVFQSNANAINDLGLIAGQISDISLLNDWSHASLWENGVVTDLGTLVANGSDWSACSGATSMNDLNQIVGWSGTAATGPFPCDDLRNMTAPVHAFIWRAATGMRDLGTLPGDISSVAQKINLFGVVIGSSGNTVVQDPQNQYSIQVIGHPFIWAKTIGMLDLNSLIDPKLGWTLNSVADINVWGQLVGTGTLNGETHGFLLTPRVLFR